MSEAKELTTTPRRVELRAADRQFLREFVRANAAIEIGEDRDVLLTTRLEPVAREFGLPDLAALVRQLRIGDTSMRAAVIDRMTTNETSWFRDPTVFADLTSDVIPLVLRQKAPGEMLTIWSAASSSGQEIYSLAMTLDQHFPQLTGTVPRVRLLATDLSATMVERVRSGTYSEIEIRRGLPDHLRDRYFEQKDESWTVRQKLRRLVFARTLNLNEPLGVVPKCDLVLMRNVLIYFADDVKESILERIRAQVLRPRGALVLGGTELLINSSVGFEPVPLPNGVCYVPVP